MTVDDAQAKIDSEQFAEYMAFYELEPFGREWDQAGSIAATVGNTVGRKDGKQWVPRDFWPVEKPEQTAEEMEAALVAALGAPNGI